MYKQKLTQEQKDRLRAGDKTLLLALLESSDEKIVEELRSNKDDVRFLQGASHIVQNLLKVLG
jgi:hypothetical protein